MIGKLALCVLLVLISVSVSNGQDTNNPFRLDNNPFLDASEYTNYFKYYHECQPIHLMVAEPTPEAEASEIGLTYEALQDITELAFRRANLYTEEESTPGVLLHSQIVGGAYLLFISFHKPVTDTFGYHSPTVTFYDYSLGTHDGDVAFILSQASELMDRFVSEYLRVNQDAC